MMQKLFSLLVAIMAAVASVSADSTLINLPLKKNRLSEGLRFCEGSVVYGNSLLVSNFGTQKLNPLNNEGKGYIVKTDGVKSEVFIPADGNLSAPKGMAVSDDYLFIADVGKVVIYNLKNKTAKPQVIVMPEGDLFVNDIVVADKWAYISVTNTGKIYKLDISTPNALSATKLSVYTSVPGANGLVVDGRRMFVASYPADGNTTNDHVIYLIADRSVPKPQKFIMRKGQYDGLALYKNKLYFTNWVNNEIGYVDIMTKTVKLIALDGFKLTGPADISVWRDKLYIPNLPSSEVIVFPLK